MDDWLDARLQEDQYLPDQGFTARVMDRLPASPVLDPRRRLLFLAPFLLLACVTVWVQTLSTRPELVAFARNFRSLLRHADFLQVFSTLAYLLEQPTVLFGCLGAGILAAYLGSPTLRRWV
jgi:hypothetical protein